eukprot:360120-Chlamydomonas_euryale.AAC.3
MRGLWMNAGGVDECARCGEMLELWMKHTMIRGGLNKGTDRGEEQNEGREGTNERWEARTGETAAGEGGTGTETGGGKHTE